MNKIAKDQVFSNWKTSLLGIVIYGFIRFYSLFLRIEIRDENNLFSNDYSGDTAVFPMWHDRILLFTFCLCKLKFAPNRFAFIVSPSHDGAVIARALKPFNLIPIRGSSTRRGIAAFREMQKYLTDGINILITPDGPQGPLHEVKSGLVQLAKTTDKNIHVVDIYASSVWRIRTWDSHIIPKPFSRVVLEISTTIPPVAAKADKQALKDQQALLNQKITRDTSIPKV